MGNSFVPEDTGARACFCVGPQNGQPLCPCRMRNVTVKDGRYIEIIDHGPVSDKAEFEDAFRMAVALKLASPMK